MLKVLARVFVVALLASVAVSSATAQEKPAAAGSGAENVDQALAKFRDSMQAQRADIMAKGLTLSADQAAKFWPLFKQYQAEQNVIIDAQIDGIKAYAAHYDTLNDTDAVNYVKSLLDRDAKMDALRVKWLPKFQAAVPGGLAARAIQLDRRLSQLAQAELSSQIPLVH